MKVDDCNSGAKPHNTDYVLYTTITTHHFHIITAKVMLIIPIKNNRMICMLHI